MMNGNMKVNDLLSLIAQIAKEQKLPTPFVVGGAPRDKVMGRLENVADLDITTGDDSIYVLARETAKRLGERGHYMAFPDGHSQIEIDGIKLDFSSNFRSPDIDQRLKRAGLRNPTPMLQELYSRDFTVNALLMSMDLHTIKDPTGMGLRDIKRKTIRTCLPAAITLRDDPKRIIRTVYLGSKLGFDLDDEIVHFIKRHPDEINKAKTQYVTKKLLEAYRCDKGLTVKLLDKLGLWKKIHISQEMAKEVIGKLERV